MPVQPLLDCHRNHHPSNGRGIAIFWTASTATAAATDTATTTQPMEEASATATATHPMEEPSHKMKIMRLRINQSIWFDFLSRKRLWFEFLSRKRLSGKQNFLAKITERGTKMVGDREKKNGNRSKNGGWWPGMHWQIIGTGFPGRIPGLTQRGWVLVNFPYQGLLVQTYIQCHGSSCDRGRSVTCITSNFYYT